jgi:hypothetical protein
MRLLSLSGLGCGKPLGVGLGVFSRFIRFEMEDGSKIRFWYDLWCGGQPLKEAFLGLFSIACCKKVLMTKDVQFINDTLSGISFSRSIHD